MVWFVSVAIAIVLCGVAFLFGRAMRSEAEPGSPEADRGLIVIVLATIVFVIWVGAHTALSALKQIEAGHVGVVYEFGEIVGLKGDGLQFISPWQEIKTESIRTQQHTFTNVRSFSAEGLDVFASVTVDYRVDRESVLLLYKFVGPSWFDILVEPRINQFLKAAVVRYEADEVMANSEEIESRLREALGTDLETYRIAVESLEISEWNMKRR